jgi:hypothetical protein
VGGKPILKYHYFEYCFTYLIENNFIIVLNNSFLNCDIFQRHCQMGSSAGAAHLLKDNASVLR